MKYKIGDYIVTDWFIDPVKIISIDEEEIIVLVPSFTIYDNDDVAFFQSKIEINDIVDFSTKDAFIQAAESNLADYKNKINQCLTKMQNLIEVID
jgi:hypothetical protein